MHLWTYGIVEKVGSSTYCERIFYRVILASVQEVKSLEFKHYPPLVVKFFDILDGRSAKRAHQAKRGRQGEAAQCDAQLRTK